MDSLTCKYKNSDSDHRPQTSDYRLQTQTTDSDYRLGLQTWTTDSDYRLGLQTRATLLLRIIVTDIIVTDIIVTDIIVTDIIVTDIIAIILPKQLSKWRCTKIDKFPATFGSCSELGVVLPLLQGQNS